MSSPSPAGPPDPVAPRESSFARQRGRPMRGCIRRVGCAVIWLCALLIIASSVLYWYFGSQRFALLVKNRIERTLENRLGREVTIGKVIIRRDEIGRVILQDLSIANVPGGRREAFATVREIEIIGGIESFWTRTIGVGRVDVRDARMNIEIFPAGHELSHNFPSWKRGPRRGYEITRLEIEKMFITGAVIEMLDHRHDIQIVAENISSEVTPTFRRSIYTGIAESPSVMIRLKDYEPIQTSLRAAYDYQPGRLQLSPVALRGEGLEIIAQGALDPLTQAVYEFEINARTELARVREIFAVEPELEGEMLFSGGIRGVKGEFSLDGDFTMPSVVADTYELDDVRGSLQATQESLGVRIESANYGGGTLSADYRLAQYAEPYPMSVDLDFASVSIEKLFEDWNVANTGLRGGATGTLAYNWEKSDLLGGRGEGTARLSPGAVAFGNARYPMPVSGRTDFALSAGTVSFRPSTLQTPQSTIRFSGPLRIDGLVADLDVDITARDFAELDRIAFNFARALDQSDFELLGLGGSGTIRGTVQGPLDQARVRARVDGSAIRYAGVVLGSGEIDLRYDGERSTLHFDPASFRDGGGSIVLRGSLTFPERGPSPRFDLTADVANYSVEKILDVVDLDLALSGRGTGSLAITGTPEDGRVVFRDVAVEDGARRLALNGSIDWAPGEGNLTFDLNIATTDYPVADLLAFLEIEDIPVTGLMTGTLHLEGPKSSLEGAGSVIVRNGSVYGEPVEMATADLEFSGGVMTARAIEVRGAFGVVRGEASVDLENERFSYSIEPTDIDISELAILGDLAQFLSGTVRVESSGAGDFEHPDLLIDATLTEAALRGVRLPEGVEPPRIYLAIRGGQLRIIGSGFGAITVEGEGTVAENGALDGRVRIEVLDAAKLMAVLAPRAEFPVTGTLAADLQLGGFTTSLETLEIFGSVPEMSLTVSGQEVVPVSPIDFSLRNGSLLVESFRVRTGDSQFALAGSIGLTGSRALDLRLDGTIDAAIAQLLMPDLRSSGQVVVSASVTGTFDSPRARGSAEVRRGELRIPGFPQVISDITGTLVFHGDRLEIDSLTASVGGGQIVAGGSIGLDGLNPTGFSIRVSGTDTSLRYFEGITLDGDFTLVLSGDPERSILRGEIVVDRALYYQDFNLTTSVLEAFLGGRRVIAPEIASPWQENVGLEITVEADDTLAVRNNIADVTGSARLELRGTLASPTIIGDVSIDEGGTIEFQDIEYRVVRGTIEFQNPFQVDPYFDITAEARRGEYDLTINLTGTLEKIDTTITSDPPTSDLTLLSLISPGLEGADPSQMELRSLGAAGSSILLQSLGQAIGTRIFPFADSFRLDSGLLTDVADPKVTFEKQVQPDLRAIVVYFINSGRHIELVEWQVTPDWTIQFTQDTQLESEFIIDSVEGRFRRRYQGHWFSRDDRSADLIVAERAGEVLPAPAASPDDPAVVPLTQTMDAPVVASIEFVAETPVNPERLRELTSSIAVGKPLAIADMQSSIRALHGTGEFGDVRVDASSAGEGAVALRFLLYMNYRVREIDFEGLPMSRERLGVSMAVRRDDVLSLNAVDRTAGAIAEELNRRGWLEATVDPEVEFSRAANRADVTFHVTTGPTAKVAGVELEGSLEPFSPEELKEAMRLEPGSTFRLADARRDAERMRSRMVEQGHRRATVRYLDRIYDPEAATVQLQYRVEAGPPVRVEVEGVERSAVRRLLPFRDEGDYSEDQVERSRDRILEFYQGRGHFFAEVEVDERMVEGEFVITYRIDPGDRYELERIEFAGNEQLDDETLRGALTARPSGGFRSFLSNLFRRPTGLRDETLEEDTESLLALYRLEGFQSATIGRPVVNTIGDQSLELTFPIEEGPRTIVTEVRVEGNERFERDALPAGRVAAGNPLNMRNVFLDILALQAFYAERGHVNIQVAHNVEMGEDPTTATVVYQITEGSPVDVGQVAIRGNTYTETEVIERQAKLEPGEPFSYLSLLESQRELYRLGIFQRVDVDSDTSATDSATRNVVISVEEGRALTLGGSLGYSEEQGVGGSFSLSHRNLMGTGRFLGLEARYFQRDRRYQLTYREPFILDWNIPVQLSLYTNTEDKDDEAIFDRRGVYVEASRVVRESLRWAARYEYRIVECVDLVGRFGQGCSDPDAPPDERVSDVASVSPTVFWDRRNDQLNPTDGYFASASLEYAFPLFSANANFLKQYAQSAWYQPLPGRTTIALSARFGLIHPLSGGASSIPFAEQFTAGGESTHRAFELDRLGVLCEPGEADCEPTLIEVDGKLYPLGGNALVLANAEYRFPIFGGLQGAVFVDVGNIYAEIDAIDWNRLRYGAGAGIRYITPLGPVRFDVGYNLDRRPEEDPFVTFLTIGFAY